MEAWNYIVSVGGQAFVMPALWSAVFLHAGSDWWFKGEVGWGSIWFSGYVIGYYAQDCIFYWKDNSSLIIAHHIASITLVLCAYMSHGWRGLNITMGLTYETGSLLMGLVDLNFAPRNAGPIVMAVTTVLGMGFVVQGLWGFSPPDAAGWATAILALGGGLARLQQSHAYLVSGEASKDQD